MFDKKEWDKQYHKQWYKDNREKVLKQNKDYSRTKKGKAVHKKAVEKFRKVHPGIANEYALKYRTKLKKRVNDYKLSRGCSVCGYNKCASALDFHHKGDDKEFTVARGYNNNMNFEKVKKEMDKCDILCANCHRELHEKERKV